MAEDGALIGDAIYRIEYTEDQWFRYDAERMQHCKDTWKAKAEQLGARFVALRLIPDPLFPRGARELPYIEWQEPIEQAPECGFTITVTVDVELTGDYTNVDPVRRALISRAMEDKAAPGTVWRILTRGGNVLEHGRI